MKLKLSCMQKLHIPSLCMRDNLCHKTSAMETVSTHQCTVKMYQYFKHYWNNPFLLVNIYYYFNEREMFYLTTHSTHFIYSYMASDIWLRTILIVRKETRCRHIGYSYRLTARVLLYAPSHRQDNTYHSLCYTSRGALAGARNSSMDYFNDAHNTKMKPKWLSAADQFQDDPTYSTVYSFTPCQLALSTARKVVCQPSHWTGNYFRVSYLSYLA